MIKRLLASLTLLTISFILIGCETAQSQMSPTMEVSPTNLPSEEPIATASPTMLLPTVTLIPPSATPSKTGGLPEGCVDALIITDEHIGQTLCLGGIVGSIWNKSGDYHIMFKGAGFETLFLVSFDWPTTLHPGAVPGDCVYLEKATVTRDIERYLNAMFLPEQLQFCNPTGQSLATSGKSKTTTPTRTSKPVGTLPAGCLNALDVTIDQAGQTLCLGGFVDQAWGDGGDYFIFFNKNRPSTLYFVSYGWPAAGASGARKGDCVYLERATITPHGESAILATFTPHELKHCIASDNK